MNPADVAVADQYQAAAREHMSKYGFDPDDKRDRVLVQAVCLWFAAMYIANVTHGGDPRSTFALCIDAMSSVTDL